MRLHFTVAIFGAVHFPLKSAAVRVRMPLKAASRIDLVFIEFRVFVLGSIRKRSGDAQRTFESGEISAVPNAREAYSWLRSLTSRSHVQVERDERIRRVGVGREDDLLGSSLHHPGAAVGVNANGVEFEEPCGERDAGREELVRLDRARQTALSVQRAIRIRPTNTPSRGVESVRSTSLYVTSIDEIARGWG